MNNKLNFSGFIENVFGDQDKYSFYFDGKQLNLNMLENDSVMFGVFNKRIDFLTARYTTGGIIGLYKNVCSNNLFNHTAIIYPSMIFASTNIDIVQSKFNRLLFKGNIVNKLFPPIQKVKYDSARDFNIKCDGSKVIELKSFEETDFDFDSILNGKNVHCRFGVYWPGTIKESDENLGELTSYFEIDFEDNIDIREIETLYNKVRKFFQFLAKQKDVYFEEIEVGIKTNDNKYNKIGNFIDNISKENDVIIKDTIKSLMPHMDKLFSKICENDLNYNFIAKDKFESKYITPESYIKVCGAFEHNYKIVFKTLPTKDRYKLDSIKYINDLLFTKIEKENLSNKYVNYYTHVIELLENDINSVETQYNRCLKHYRSAISDLIKRIIKRYNIEDSTILGFEFSKFRNIDAHGGFTKFENTSVCAFIVALILLECMILEESKYTIEEISSIIKERYKYYY